MWNYLYKNQNVNNILSTGFLLRFSITRSIPFPIWPESSKIGSIQTQTLPFSHMFWPMSNPPPHWLCRFPIDTSHLKTPSVAHLSHTIHFQQWLGQWRLHGLWGRLENHGSQPRNRDWRITYRNWFWKKLKWSPLRLRYVANNVLQNLHVAQIHNLFGYYMAILE